MEFVRHRVESIFTDPIRLLLKGCSIEARNRPRISKTGKSLFCGIEDFVMELMEYQWIFEGYGWWEIMILDAAAIEDSNGHSCDDWDDCDTYIKLYIDGREVYRRYTLWFCPCILPLYSNNFLLHSDTKYNNHMPYFGETYKSPKMLKKARVRIEMYDEDSGWMQSSDDLILRWDTVNIWRRNGKPSSQKQ